MLDSCAKTKQILYIVPAGCLQDEKYIVFECPALQALRDRYEILFQAPQGDAMFLFM